LALLTKIGEQPGAGRAKHTIERQQGWCVSHGRAVKNLTERLDARLERRAKAQWRWHILEFTEAHSP